MIRNTNAVLKFIRSESMDDGYGGTERTPVTIKEKYPAKLTRRISRTTIEHLRTLLQGKDFRKIKIMECPPGIKLEEGNFAIEWIDGKLSKIPFEIVYLEPVTDVRGAVRFLYAILEENTNTGGVV